MEVAGGFPHPVLAPSWQGTPRGNGETGDPSAASADPSWSRAGIALEHTLPASGSAGDSGDSNNSRQWREIGWGGDLLLSMEGKAGDAKSRGERAGRTGFFSLTLLLLQCDLSAPA